MPQHQQPRPPSPAAPMTIAQAFDSPIVQCITRRCARQFRMRSGEIARSDRHAIGKSIA
jgi:hypothetical protein